MSIYKHKVKKTKLKSCPFCGCKPTIVRGLFDGSCIRIECLSKRCRINPGGYTTSNELIDEAIKTWNIRKEKNE